MSVLQHDPADVCLADAAKVALAGARFRLERVDDPAGPAFEAAWALLDGFFGPRGELEERGALERFVRERRLSYGPGAEGYYHQVVAWDGDTVVGVRDCYVDIDSISDVCLVALSHSFVVPACRRSGLAALFRSVPVTLARRILAQEGRRAADGGEVPILLAAEMEPVAPEDDDAVVRLLAYGRSGFSTLDPARLPYSQPDFRDLVALGAAHLAIPLLAVVRWVGHEDAAALPLALAAAFPRLFHACHRMYLAPERVDPSEVHALRALTRVDGPVPLLPLPRALAEVDRLAPLMRSAVLALYPDILRGPHPELGDPVEELERLRKRWMGR